MNGLRVVAVQLSQEDHTLLTEIAAYTGVTMSDVVRWSIRHYGLTGPWPIGSESIRTATIGKGRRLVVGPMSMEVCQ